jgi:SAM-dependent methyltransferase
MREIMDIHSSCSCCLTSSEYRPDPEAVALDVSPTMLKSARDHFAGDSRIKITELDLSQPLPDLGYFDAVVSSFAIHHLKHECKRELYEEIYDIINPTGVFCNLEHVASPCRTACSISQCNRIQSRKRR